MKIRDIQARLLAHGYSPGPIDGIWGRRSISATKAFQSDRGLKVDGIVGPKTIAALNARLVTSGYKPPVPELAGAPVLPWLAEARRRLGLHETRDRSSLMAWLRSDGRTLGDPAKLPWCGDFIETCIALTLPDEALPGNPYLARNWQRFGVEVPPTLGAVGVFWRGSRAGTSGHVGLLVGQDDGAYHVLGGNQSDAVTVARLTKDRLLGAYWPKTFTAPKILLPKGTLADTRLSVNEA